MLRDTFNAVVEFVATKQLLTAARPGELIKCTFEEVEQATMFKDDLYISVSKHKTGSTKQATIAVEQADQETFLRYVAILKRFKKGPTMAFPFLSPSKGFVVSSTHNNQGLRAESTHILTLSFFFLSGAQKYTPETERLGPLKG